MQKTDLSNFPFEYYSSELKYCFGYLHVKQATFVIGILGIILTIFSYLNLLRTQGLDFDVQCGIMFLPEIFILILLFFGVRREKSYFLLPFLICHGIVILLIPVVIAIIVFAILNPDSEFGKTVGDMPLINMFDCKEQKISELKFEASTMFIAFFYLFSSILFFWSFYVVFKCYKHFKKLNEIHEISSITTEYSS